jgi:hypothetical protein
MRLWQPKRRVKKFSKQVVDSFDWVEQLKLKVELIHGKTYNTHQETKSAILGYIEGYCNR